MIERVRNFISLLWGWLSRNILQHFWYLIVMGLGSLQTFSFSNEPPQEIALSNDKVWVFGGIAAFLCVVIYNTRRKYATGFQSAGENELLTIVWFIIALVTVVGMLPAIIGSTARHFQVAILACPDPRMVDYTWFVLDNVAKGVLLDFLESFDFDLYDQVCAPMKHNTVTSIIKFSIRSFSTYILIWFAIKLWASMRARLLGIT
jgi:hypothetical protein